MIVKARRLPAGFAFPVTRRALKEALRPFAEKVDIVELGGISHSERSMKEQGGAQVTWFWIGMVDTLWAEGSCRFQVRIHGVRRERIESLSEPVGRLIERDIMQFVERTLSLRETDPARGRSRSCHLGFNLGADGSLESRSFVPEPD